ncbi:MAG: hypothetical protein WDZ64_01885 [Parcubacteria group bacterium]
MKELQKKQKITRFVYSMPFLVILAIGTFFLAKASMGVLEKERETAEYLEELENRVVELSLREEELREDITQLRTDEGVMQEIKEKFSVTQEGEYVAIFVDDVSTSSELEETSGSWFKRFWSAIIGGK